MKRLVIIPWLLALVIGATEDTQAKPPSLTPAQIKAIADRYAKSQLDDGPRLG